MQIPCAKCGKTFEKAVVTGIMNLCHECFLEDNIYKNEMPEFFNDIFGGFDGSKK